MFHDEHSLGAIHVAHNWEYADATEREAATGFVTADLKKLALQEDDNTLWMLTAITPTWKALGDASSVTASSVVTANALVLGEDGARNLKGVPGLTTDGTSRVQLGVAGGAVGGVELRNATSGTASIVPPTGALGTAVHTLPTGTGTLFSSTTKSSALQAAQLVTLTSSSTDTYAGTAGVAATAYAVGDIFAFKANFANAGAASLNVDTLGAKTIVKVAGGVTTALADNDIRVNQMVVVQYDGTNFQMQSTLGNAGGGGVGDMLLGTAQTVTATKTFTTAAATTEIVMSAASSQNGQIRWNGASSAAAIIGQAGAAGGILTGSGVNDLNIYSNNGRINFSTASGGSSIGLQLLAGSGGTISHGSGAVPFVVPLTITPSSGSATITLSAAAAQWAALIFSSASANNANIGQSSATNQGLSGSAVGDLVYLAGNGGNHLFSVNNSTIHFQISSSGIKTAAPSGGTAAFWKLGVVASVSPTSPNRTIELDVAGTRYFIHAKTTND